MYYVYILSTSNGLFYTGVTGNLKQRLEDHQNGRVMSTKHKLPVKLVHYEAYLLKSDAMRRERFLKTSDGKRFLKQQISDLYKLING